ncbi:MAG: hypothetical protein HZA59_04225 [Hydrogenophilales bacterium]|nr:hypothetical protein [Hydrogenophilales bacterium]
MIGDSEKSRTLRGRRRGGKRGELYFDGRFFTAKDAKVRKGKSKGLLRVLRGAEIFQNK